MARERPGLSAFIIAKNEAARLPRAIEALRGLADEVVVVDSGSTDGTPELAERLGARVFVRDWRGYGPQKRFAEEQCRHDWLLNVDADEVVTPELAEEIRRVVREEPPSAWKVRILNVYPGDARPRPLANDYNVVRLYHVEAGRYRDHPLFDRVETLAPPRQLRGALWHYPFLTWHALIQKQNAYTTFQAQAARRRPLWLLKARLAVEFPYVFLKTYLLRGHALGGWKGFAFSVALAHARFLRIVKLIEREESAD
ncbi:glycosyltransferase family 2 protein [Oceanicella actignis]|uniref:Glycosyltransferase involved in cell wall bisynthesis n=1 Tax=Oceanicella actignis TaxID=1189325 RepID=A0A1M7TYB3_9RHOB|nr:glycosyltransferase family 2 protein [Oceanicella actignis]TYO89667.1 glycosyltransferase involved in cell wall biosynthesis [Oceanicella actignis]SET81685.1 Glycosyltransferase involved in cell wall bisynthesis [Oceanicella actignis]SHN75719.1 Glycosyltransferase involved in cell wall bisynthesis [Oceanicella actignis]